MLFFQRAATRKKVLCLALFCILILPMIGCSSETETTGGDDQKQTIVLADASWDSIQVHNRIVGFILENGYGYPVDYRFGETLPLLQGLRNGDVQIYMEIWADNILEAWEKALNEGSVQNLGVNFPDAPQGWYVPTYLIQGDPARGLEPVAPDLKSVFDLPRYKDLFPDQEVSSKGRFHNSPPGWVCTAINEEKIAAYRLDEHFNIFSTGSDTALVTSMVSAYEKGEPWLGYYWEPTWVMGKLDMTRLEEPAYSQEVWDQDKACAYPFARVFKGIHSGLRDQAPEIIDFLEKYETSLDQNNDMLSYLIDVDGDTEKAAVYFLKNYPEVWQSWLPEELVAKVETALNEVD